MAYVSFSEKRCGLYLLVIDKAVSLSISEKGVAFASISVGEAFSLRKGGVVSLVLSGSEGGVASASLSLNKEAVTSQHP